MVIAFYALVSESLFRETVTSGVAGLLGPETNNHNEPLKRNYDLNKNCN